MDRYHPAAPNDADSRGLHPRGHGLRLTAADRKVRESENSVEFLDALYAGLAQLGERLTRNEKVASSSLAPGSTFTQPGECT